MLHQWIPTHFRNQRTTSVPLLQSGPQVYQTLQHHSFSATLDLWTVQLCVVLKYAYFPSCSVMFHLFQILWMSFDINCNLDYVTLRIGTERRQRGSLWNISQLEKIGPGSAAGAASLIYKCKDIYMCVCIYIIIRVYEDKNVYVYDHVNHVY